MTGAVRPYPTTIRKVVPMRSRTGPREPGLSFVACGEPPRVLVIESRQHRRRHVEDAVDDPGPGVPQDLGLVIGTVLGLGYQGAGVPYRPTSRSVTAGDV